MRECVGQTGVETRLPTPTRTDAHTLTLTKAAGGTLEACAHDPLRHATAVCDHIACIAVGMSRQGV